MYRKNGTYKPIKFHYEPLTHSEQEEFFLSKGLKLEDNYEELQKEYDLLNAKPAMQCCVEEDGQSPFIINDGYPTCTLCGKVQTAFRELDDIAITKPSFGELLGMNNGYVFVSPRFYKPLSHFREHLRRYMGANRVQLNDEQLNYLKQNLDETNPKAYMILKELLKNLNLPRQYRNIWSILYQLGGKLPELSNHQFHACLNIFKKFLIIFDKHKHLWNRKSIPSHYMLLNEFLVLVEHEKYYEFPVLKNEGLKKNVQFILNKCLSLYKNFVKQ
jgi:hypothetical protein